MNATEMLALGSIMIYMYIQTQISGLTFLTAERINLNARFWLEINICWESVLLLTTDCLQSQQFYLAAGRCEVLGTQLPKQSGQKLRLHSRVIAKCLCFAQRGQMASLNTVTNTSHTGPTGEQSIKKKKSKQLKVLTK